MGLSRKEARALAKTTFEALGVFEAVLAGAPDLFAGRSPVAVITSSSLDFQQVARELYEETSTITASIYVRRDAGAAQAAASEDQLDDLARACLLALHATGVFAVHPSSAAPQDGNLRDVDRNSVLYRIERIELTVTNEGSDD
jgi:hypothetical protein